MLQKFGVFMTLLCEFVCHRLIHIALRPDKSGFKTGARGLDGLPSIDISLRWSESQMKRNADLRSLRIDLVDAVLGSGKMPDLRGRGK